MLFFVGVFPGFFCVTLLPQFDVRPASSPIVLELPVNMALDFLGVARVLINSAHNCRQKPDEGQLDAIEVSIPAFCGLEVPGHDSANLTVMQKEIESFACHKAFSTTR